MSVVSAFADFEQRRILRQKAPPQVEAELVRAFFRHSPLGFYVDVGANDPVLDSQSWHLEQLGWTGLLVEPLPDCCEKLRTQRKGTVVQVACSSPAHHGKMLTLQVAGVHSTLNEAPIAIGAQAVGQAQVMAVTLDSVLQQHGVAPGFDLLSIDVEGHEDQLFQGLTLSRWMPRLVLLEDHVTNHRKHAYMRSQGYRLLMRTGLNSWYVPQAERFRFTWMARWEFLRKYWLGLPFRKLKYAR